MGLPKISVVCSAGVAVRPILTASRWSVEHAPVLRDLVALVQETHLRVAHLAVEEVAAVALVDHDAVGLAHGGRLRPILGAA